MVEQAGAERMHAGECELHLGLNGRRLGDPAAFRDC
jgi:hypothetical protein